MKSLPLAFIALAMAILPASAHAAQCRNTATGAFAKCGSPGSVPASQYVRKSGDKPKARTKAAPVAIPMSSATTPAKPGFMAMLKAKAKPASSSTAQPAKPVRCKTMTGKFVKCGTPGAKPA